MNGGRTATALRGRVGNWVGPRTTWTVGEAADERLAKTGQRRTDDFREDMRGFLARG